MKLQTRFMQLPVSFDVERLKAEIGALGEGAWLPHPQRFEGNDFLPLISAYGEPTNEAFEGPMQPTEYLKRCPYLIDTLKTFGASLGRTRLMRLSGNSEVTPHIDVNYYWRDRMRIHVPIVTQPSVTFYCGGEKVHMAAGECWIFDTWSRHRVVNDNESERIHLVADSVGGEGFWELALGARAHSQPTPAGWAPRLVEPFGAKIEDLDLEATNVPLVMTPWEARDHINFLLADAPPNHPLLPGVYQATSRFHHVWRGLWSTYGESKDGWPRYREALDRLVADLQAARANDLPLRSGAGFMGTLHNMVVSFALSDGGRDLAAGEQREDIGPRNEQPVPLVNRLPSIPDPQFDRPIFVVNPPRSGSSLLFETLAQSPTLFTVGGESHALIEGVDALGIAARNWDSNRLTLDDADPEVVAQLRARFAASVRDRQGRSPPRGARVRMLEKTPKNSLRIPFLAAAFPEARFVYLYRDTRQVLASMMEAWESGRFRTYPKLPGWSGALPWSMLLTPGWRDLAALPLNEIAAHQWVAATKIMLDDLEALPADRRVVTRYDALVADPGAEVKLLADALDFAWDRPLGNALPVAAHTVSAPKSDKWRARETEIMAVMPIVSEQAQRAAAFAAR
ncbi:MAG: sulfotransferase [Hyphomonadaceae bacterium]